MFRPSMIGMTAVVLLAACSDRQGPVSPRANQPALAISDGAHSGNADFFFLPPMAANPSNNPAFEAGKFNGRLAPTVSICMLDEASASTCAADIRTFAASEISLGDQQYHVNWNTKETPLLLSRMYRIAVFVGSVRVGYVDVDPVSNGSQLRTVTNEYIGLVDGRTLPIKFRIEKGATCANYNDCAEEIVTNAGATVVTKNGYAGVEFPSGWLPAGYTSVVVKIVRVPIIGETQCHRGLQLPQFEGCYEFSTIPYVGPFALPVIAGICPELTPLDPRYDQLSFYSSGEGEGPPKAAPSRSAPFISCEGFAATPPPPTGGFTRLDRMTDVMLALASSVSNFLSPKSAYAIDLGWGGELLGFSRGGWVLDADMQILSGNGQTGSVGTALAAPISVRVIGHDVANIPITFSAGAGSVAATGPVLTNADGVASTTWTLGPSAGTQSVTVSSPVTAPVIFTATGTTVTADIPNPILAYRHSEQYTANDQVWDRYRLTVTNRASYPASLFAIDPSAPACASNARVNIYDGTTNAYIYGFCGLSAPDQLNDIWFAVPRWTQPPASVYITITDQAANVTYTSNTINLYAPLFVNFPRAVLFNGTNSVAGATSYTLEVQICDSWASPDWRTCSSTWVAHLTATLPTGAWNSTQTVAGDNTYRWRVVARNSDGVVVNETDYKHFRYITGSGAP